MLAKLKENATSNISDEDIFDDLMDVAVETIEDKTVPWNIVKRYADEVSKMYISTMQKEPNESDLKVGFKRVWECSLVSTLKAMEIQNVNIEEASEFFKKFLYGQIGVRTVGYLRSMGLR